MRISLLLGFLAAALVASTVWGLTELSTDIGDVGPVEIALASEPPAPPLPSVSGVPSSETRPDSRWNPNDRSLLTEVGDSDRPTPVLLTIDRIGVSAPIGAYGTDTEGLMEVPGNVTDVGRYRYGPRPGEPGSSVLAAHVDLAGPGRGVFFELDELVEGDLISVTFSDGTSDEFKVEARTTYSKEELPVDVIFSREGPPVLTLITCGGGFSRSERSYDSNVVVYAVPADSGGDDLDGPELS